MKRIMSMLLIVLAPWAAAAHNLDVGCTAEGDELVIQVWAGNEAAAGASISILAPNDTPRASGVADEKGVFRYRPAQVESLIVHVYAEAGHEKTFTISADDINALLHPAAAPTQASSGGAAPVTIFSSQLQRQQGVHILIGITFILALAACWLSWGNRKQLKELEKRLNGRAI